MARKSHGAVLFISLAAALLFAAGCGDDDDDSDTPDTPETLELISDPEGETFAVVDLGEKGTTAGDIYVFDGPMLDPDSGDVAGQVYGTQTSLSLDDGAEVVQAMITYEVGEGNQILVGGTAEYSSESDGLAQGEEYVRPIIGGTGDYADAGGTMTTVRQSDGSYEQTFDFGD